MTGAALAAATALAEAPADLEKMFLGAINGTVSFQVKASGNITYKRFQMKAPDADDSAWADIAVTQEDNPFFANTVHAYRAPASFVGARQFRVCETNLEGEASAWTDLGVATNSAYYAYTAIGDKRSGGINDGNCVYPWENNSSIAGHSPVWIGAKLDEPRLVTKLRYVPRQDQTGANRIGGDEFQCADDPTFLTNVVTLGTVPAAADIVFGKVLEFNLTTPVRSRYFRLLHKSVKDAYGAMNELEVTAAELPKPISIAVAAVSWEDMRPSVTWSVPLVDQCTTACVQRSTSPLGPFTDLTAWSDATTGGTFVDTTAAVGVRYFYRVKADSDALGFISCSDAVFYARARRLERDPDDLTKLRTGMSVIPCYSYVQDASGYYSSGGNTHLAFDGDVSTIPETSTYVSNNTCRVVNPLVGVDLGTPCHVVGIAGYPRANQLTRMKNMALFGANAEHMVDAAQLSGEFSSVNPQYGCYNYMAASTDFADETYRYVYLLAPGSYSRETFANVAEVGFFGYSRQDTVDSLELVPPVTVAAAGTAQNVAVTWAEGANVARYDLERRTATGDWIVIAALPPTETSFVDYTAPADIALEYRVTARGAGDAYVYSYVTASITPGPGTFEVPPVSIVRSENLTNLAAVITWSGSCGTYVRDGTLQRAVSAAGPFEDIEDLASPVATLVVTDLTAVAGVTYYYRVRYACDDPLSPTLTEIASAPVPFIRARRLERDWNDLTQLRSDVTLMYPYKYYGGGTFIGEYSPLLNFDSDLTTFSESKCTVGGVRALNAALGVVLPCASHVIGAIAYPRPDSNYSRSSLYALYGGSSDSDTNTWVQLSPMLNFSKVEWKSVSSSDVTNAYQYVFVWSPHKDGAFAPTYGNMTELGFFGYSDQDIVDSGLLIPPTTVAVATNSTCATVTWDRGWNMDSYRVERRRVGDAAWTTVATVEAGADRTFADTASLRKGTYEYRVTAVAAGKDDISSPATQVDLKFKRGFVFYLSGD